MTGHYQYTIAQERIADLHREAERDRLAAAVARPPAGPPRQSLLARLGVRSGPARIATR